MGTQRTNWADKGNCRPRDLEAYDWNGEYWALSHPVRAYPRGQALIDYDTGEIIGMLDERYSWFWAHNHPHVCKKGWDEETYPEGWPPHPTGG